MILPFATQINGKPTHFVEKIIIGLVENNLCSLDYASEVLKRPMSEIKRLNTAAKIHTIRDDPKDRWKPGMLIDFFINNQRPDMFRFAPRVPLVRRQRVFMTYAHDDIIEISVDGRYINDVKEFARNDGFEWEDFFNYFYPKIEASEDKSYTGKLVHWTNKRY